MTTKVQGTQWMLVRRKLIPVNNTLDYVKGKNLEMFTLGYPDINPSLLVITDAPGYAAVHWDENAVVTVDNTPIERTKTGYVLEEGKEMKAVGPTIDGQTAELHIQYSNATSTGPEKGF